MEEIKGISKKFVITWDLQDVSEKSISFRYLITWPILVGMISNFTKYTYVPLPDTAMCEMDI